MKLMPSARPAKRYLLFDTNNKSTVEQALFEGLGILGVAKAEPLFLQAKTGKIILAVSREEIVHVRAALEIFSAPLKVIKVSGTLRGLSS